MVKLFIGTSSFTIEFRHLRRGNGKRCAFHRGPLKAISICHISVSREGDPKDRVFMNAAMCTASETFSARYGRLKSLAKTIDAHNVLREVGEELMEQYLKADPAPPPPAPRPPKVAKTAGEVEELRRAGSGMRRERMLARLAVNQRGSL